MTSRTIRIPLPEAKGEMIARLWESEADRAPLVLLHDSLGAIATWRDFPERLAARLDRSVIAYDRWGFGESSARPLRPSARFIEEEAEIYLPRVLDTLGVREFALFGHSVGGAMAVTAAAHFGSRCQAVISESAQAFVEDRTRTGIEAAATKFARPEVFAKLEKYHGPKTAWVIDAWIGVWLSPEFRDWSLRSTLAHVTSPLLILHGDQDEYGSARFPETLRDGAAGSTEMHLLTDCGHVPHREKPDLILDLVAEFLVR